MRNDQRIQHDVNDGSEEHDPDLHDRLMCELKRDVKVKRFERRKERADRDQGTGRGQLGKLVEQRMRSRHVLDHVLRDDAVVARLEHPPIAELLAVLVEALHVVVTRDMLTQPEFSVPVTLGTDFPANCGIEAPDTCTDCPCAGAW